MSALDVSKIVVGAHSKMEAAPYVTAKGAGTFVDLGASIGGATLEQKVEHHLTSIDQNLGDVMATPKRREVELKVKLVQAEMDTIATALGLPDTAVTGTPPNEELDSDLSQGEVYFQLKLTGKGLGTTGVRTWTAWRAYAKSVAPIVNAKDAEQALEVTFGILEETTGTGTESWMAVDA